MSNIDPATGLPYPNLYTTENSPAVVPTDANGYIDVGITVDPNQLNADAYGFIAAQIPGWTPADGNLETWVIMACARMVATAAAVAAQVPLTIFSYLGGQLLGIPPLPGAAAQVDTTWTMIDDQGYTVPAGTQYAFPTSGNTYAEFATLADFTVPAGQTATAAGAVPMAAVAVGTAANGIPAGALSPVTSLAYVATVVSTAPTAGGAAAETTAAYLNRLSDQLQLLTPRPILAADFAALAVEQDGVARALALDNFSPYVNTLTAADASFETGVGSWTAGTNTTVAASTTWAADGTHSLALTATASGAATATSGTYPVSPGQAWSATVLAHAVTTARSVTVGLAWTDINGNPISTTAGTATPDSTSGGVQVTATGSAPTNAAYVAVKVTVAGCAASEVHAVDEAGLFLGAATYTWGPGGTSASQERSVTVIPVDVNGDPLTTEEMGALSAYLESLREINFLVNVVPPTFCAIDVVAAVVSEPGADVDAVQPAVQAAVDAYLAPGTWAGGGQSPPVWLNDTTVYPLSIAGVIDNVAGVHHIATLTVNGGTTPIVMPGYAPLPTATVSVTVTPAAAGT